MSPSHAAAEAALQGINERMENEHLAFHSAQAMVADSSECLSPECLADNRQRSEGFWRHEQDYTCDMVRQMAARCDDQQASRTGAGGGRGWRLIELGACCGMSSSTTFCSRSTLTEFGSSCVRKMSGTHPRGQCPSRRRPSARRWTRKQQRSRLSRKRRRRNQPQRRPNQTRRRRLSRRKSKVT